MLVVISDLHLIDSTAGRHNVPPEWFENIFCRYIPQLAKEKKAKELKVLLMGDIVDLIRTEKWLEDEFDPSDRPWGENGRSDIEKAVDNQPIENSKTEERCLEILGEKSDLEEASDHDKKTIFSRNWKTFRLFREDFKEKVKQVMGDDDFNVELIYIPGNHDRLCNLYPSLRDSLKDALGLTTDESDGDWWYLDDFKDEAYGVYARHGHEYDVFNYGGQNNFTRTGQLQVSIGDTMATEFAVKVPWLVREYVREGLSIPNADDLIMRLQEGDNVRPVGSVVEWFYYSIQDRDAGNVRKALQEAIRQAVKEMLEIKLVQQWRSPETHWDEAVRAASSPWLRWLPSEALKSFDAEGLLTLLGKGTGKDPHTEAAYSKENWRQEEDIRYILYGHTHEPLLHPLEVSDNREVLYINTGTCRDRIFKTVPLNPNPQFYLLDQITYVVFYRRDEDTDEKKPNTLSFDMWTGSGKKVIVERTNNV